MPRPSWGKTQNRLREHHCSECRYFPEGATRELCSFHSKHVNASQSVCLDGRMREKREDAIVANTTGTNDTSKIQRVIRTCKCGFTTDWPAAWAKHTKGKDDREHHESTMPPQSCIECNHSDLSYHEESCDGCTPEHSAFEPETQPEATPRTTDEDDDKPLAADIAAVDPIARQIAEDTLEASDVAATIAQAARLDGGRITLADLAAEGIGIRLTPKDPERALRAELIDTHLRLVISELQASLHVVPASLICSLQDRLERVQELVLEVAS